MANTMRWRYGETNPVMMPAVGGTAIEIGDLVFLDAGVAKPASGLTDAGTLAANQEAFHDKFLGVAMQASPLESTDPIRIATSGVFEFDCLSATFELGALVGIKENAGGNEVEDQFVIGVATPNLAVGRCVKRVSPAGLKVFIDVVSTVVRGGPQPVA